MPLTGPKRAAPDMDAKLLMGLIYTLGSILKKVERIEKTMATRQEMNDKIDSVNVKLGTLGTELRAAIDRLINGANFDAEVAKLQTIADGIDALTTLSQGTGN